MIERWKSILDWRGFTLLLGILATIFAYLAALAVGPLPVFVGLEKTDITVPPGYIATVGFPLGILMAEGLIDFRKHGFSLQGVRIFVSVALLLLALFFTKDPKLLGLDIDARHYLFVVPLSGHALIVTFFLLHEMCGRREGRAWKLIAGALIMVQSVIIKLFIWQDPSSFVVGAALGTLVWLGTLVGDKGGRHGQAA